MEGGRKEERGGEGGLTAICLREGRRGRRMKRGNVQKRRKRREEEEEREGEAKMNKSGKMRPFFLVGYDSDGRRRVRGSNLLSPFMGGS